AQFCRRHTAGLVPGGRGRGGTHPTAVDVPGAPGAAQHLLVLVGGARAAGSGCRSPGAVPRGDQPMSLVAPTLQSFFTDRLAKQLRASPRTVASYRDSVRLLAVFVHRK